MPAPTSRRWVHLLLWAIGAYVAADLTSQVLAVRWLKVARTIPPSPAVAPPKVEPREQVVGSMAALLTQGLAPKAGASGAQAAADDGQPVPDPSATMTLLGTLVSPGASVAFVSQGGKDLTLYEGGTIEGFTVREIRSSSVLLTCRGQERTLLMPSLSGAAAPGRPPGGGLLPPPPDLAPRAGGTRSVISRSDITAAMASQEQLMKGMRVLPFDKDGKPYGMRVIYLEGGHLLNRLGVESGDVLLSINGKNLQNAEDAFNAYQTISKESHVTFRVERGGKPTPLEVDIR